MMKSQHHHHRLNRCVHAVLQQQQDPVSVATRRWLSTDILQQQLHTPVAIRRRERRRRHGVTPFERAPNQFVAIEMARLDHEQKRADSAVGRKAAPTAARTRHVGT